MPCFMTLKGSGIMNDKKLFLKVMLFETKFCFKYAPFLMSLATLSCVAHGLSFVWVTIMTQRLFDTVTLVIAGDMPAYDIIAVITVWGVAIVLNQIINGFENYIIKVSYEKLLGYSKLLLLQKTAKMKSELFENPDFLDNHNKAMEGAQHFHNPLFSVIGLFTFYLSYFLGIGMYLYSNHPVLALSVIMVFIPCFASQYLKVYLYSKLANESAPVRRRMDYYEGCVGSRELFKETRLLLAGSYFLKLFRFELKKLEKREWKTNKKAQLIELAARLITLGGYVTILVLLVVMLFNHEITIGAFSAIFLSIDKMFSMMDETVEVFGDTTKNLGLMHNYISFLNRETEENMDEDVSLREHITLDNISYQYPGSEKMVIKDVSLRINSGERIAIVGENGSGKTTLSRIMMGLLSPTQGRILYDNSDIKDIGSEFLFAKNSFVFQGYMKYQLSLFENVTISQKKSSVTGDERNGVERVLTSTGLDINGSGIFTDGLDTMLSREFGGIDISGGQWQRVAIARGLFRSHQFIILDEPTAAIDPIEENNLYHLFYHAGQDKTSVVVTHRLGAARMADRIVVMKSGKIVEIGNHNELIGFNGYYKQLYEAQAEWYLEQEQQRSV